VQTNNNKADIRNLLSPKQNSPLPEKKKPKAEFSVILVDEVS